VTASPRRPIEVPTCVACGARFRAGECADGCDDRPIDLVSVADARAAERAAQLAEQRASALRAVVARAHDEPLGDELRETARAALRMTVAPPLAPAIVEAWGCLECGRVDAPQPCLGLCTRTPQAMVQADGHRLVLADVETANAEAEALEPVVRQVAWATARPGREPATERALRDAAARALAEVEPIGRTALSTG
jgi:hypothetical protein